MNFAFVKDCTGLRRFVKVCKGLRRSLRALTRHDGDDIRHIYRKRPINLGSIANLTMAVAAPTLGDKIELNHMFVAGKLQYSPSRTHR
jgi:hypothetical protein